MSSGFGLPPGPLNYTGENVSIVPLKQFNHQPTTSDKKYRVGQFVILGANPSTGVQGELWYLSHFSSGEPKWEKISSGGEGAGDYPITPYVVGPFGQADYQTIQSAIDAATLAGGSNVIWLQPGSYTENLNITSSITFMSVDGIASITGIHTPPTSGTVTFEGLVLISSTHILNSTAAGTTTFNINDSFIIITNGYIFNVPNWTGEILMDNCGEASTDDGVINNSGGSSNVKLINVEMGAGSSNTMQINCGASGFLRFDTCNVNCAVTMGGSGSIILQNGVKFANTVTFSGSLSGFAMETCWRTGANQAIVFNSSGDLDISSCSIDSSNNPAIGGTGSGTLNLEGITFLDNSSVAGTLTIGESGETRSSKYVTNSLSSGVNYSATRSASGQWLAFNDGTDAFGYYNNAGSPEGVVTASIGSWCSDTTNGEIYVKQTGDATNTGWIQLDSGDEFNWTEITVTGPTAMTVNTGYIANNAGANVDLTLPSTAALGSVIRVSGKGAGGFQIQQNAGQTVHFAGSDTTTGAGGTITSTIQYNAIELLCTTADTDFVVLSSVGNFTIV